MTPELQVDLADFHIVVTLPGTAYRAVFFMSPDQPKLVQAKQLSVDKQAPIFHQDFEAMAWEAASARARELGWI